jgi:hypothetical protein
VGRGEAEGRSHSDSIVGSMVSSITASNSADRVSRSICWRRRPLNAWMVLAASYLRRLKRRSTPLWTRRRIGAVAEEAFVERPDQRDPAEEPADRVGGAASGQQAARHRPHPDGGRYHRHARQARWALGDARQPSREQPHDRENGVQAKQEPGERAGRTPVRRVPATAAAASLCRSTSAPASSYVQASARSLRGNRP